MYCIRPDPLRASVRVWLPETSIVTTARPLLVWFQDPSLFNHMLKPLQREAIRTFVLGKDVLYILSHGLWQIPLMRSSLTRVRPLARLLGDFQGILHFSPLTVETSPKFSVRGLQSEFYRSASTRFKERTAHFSLSNQVIYASSRCLVVRSFRKLCIKQTSSLLHALFSNYRV